MSRDVQKEIDDEVKSNKIMLYMKGTPEQPMCGFSYKVVEMLNGVGKPFASLNILADEEKRQGIKVYSDWPTIPQLYVDGEFVGGCDITTELYETGELAEMIGKVHASTEA